MNNSSNLVQRFFDNTSSDGNLLLQYIQSLNPETVAQLSQPSPEVVQIMEHNLREILGTLPAQHFGVTITTNREHLGRLLAAAMVGGYFLHGAQHRLMLEKSLQAASSS